MKPVQRQVSKVLKNHFMIRAITYFERRDELRKGDEEEVEVEEELELFVEYEWEEGESIVLLVSDYVWGKPRLELICRQ